MEVGYLRLLTALRAVVAVVARVGLGILAAGAVVEAALEVAEYSVAVHTGTDAAAAAAVGIDPEAIESSVAVEEDSAGLAPPAAPVETDVVESPGSRSHATQTRV